MYTYELTHACAFIGVVRKRILPFTTVRKGESTQPASSSSAATTWSVLDKIQSDCMNKLLSSSPDSDDDGGFVYNEIGIAKHVLNLRNGTCKMNIKDENGKAIGDVIGIYIYIYIWICNNRITFMYVYANQCSCF